MIVERTAIVKSTPETIWKTCFEHMKFEVWDPDVTETKNPSGGCENDTTFTFIMKDGQNVPTSLSNVVKHESLTFEGTSAGGLVVFSGTIVLSATPSVSETKVDYTFSFGGCLGSLIATVIQKAIVEGTEGGLENIKKLSEEAQSG